MKSRQLHETGFLVMNAYMMKRVTDAKLMNRVKKNVRDFHVKYGTMTVWSGGFFRSKNSYGGRNSEEASNGC